MYKRFSIIMLAVALSSCGTPQQKASALEENKEAKSLLEGIWLDDNTETALLRVKGDTLFYADAATAPVAFKIIGDSLITYGARTNGYKIEKQEEHIFWFHSAVGDVIRLHKSDTENDSLAFIHTREIPVYNEVIKKDSVVTYDNVRYRGYVYINPSKIKVMRPGVSEEGLGVDNVYYDNIIHICVYEGRKSLYAKDITKQMFKGVVPDDFLQWAILSDMDFMGVDSKGYHYQATVCVPDGASCYMVNITAGKDGGLAFELVKVSWLCLFFSFSDYYLVAIMLYREYPEKSFKSFSLLANALPVGIPAEGLGSGILQLEIGILQADWWFFRFLGNRFS